MRLDADVGGSVGLAEPVGACLVQGAASAASARRHNSAEQDIPGCGTAVHLGA